MDKDTGGPAFPTPAHNLQNDGITLRDYFAAKAVPISYQFWMNDYFHPDASDAEIRAEEARGDFSGVITLVAETAYEMADAMLKARGQA
jgi:hypothetical protein